MRISEEMANKLYEENQKLRKKIKLLEDDRNFIRECLFLALSRTGFTLVVQENPDDLPDEIEFDLSTGVVKNITKGKEYACNKFPEEIQKLVNAGGLINYTREKLN